jgi:hypothetical protein
MGVISQGMRLFAYVKEVDKVHHFKKHIHFLIGGTFVLVCLHCLILIPILPFFYLPKHWVFIP